MPRSCSRATTPDPERDGEAVRTAELADWPVAVAGAVETIRRRAVEHALAAVEEQQHVAERRRREDSLATAVHAAQ